MQTHSSTWTQQDFKDAVRANAPSLRIKLEMMNRLLHVSQVFAMLAGHRVALSLRIGTALFMYCLIAA